MAYNEPEPSIRKEMKMETIVIVTLVIALLISLLWINGLYAEKSFDSHFKK